MIPLLGSTALNVIRYPENAHRIVKKAALELQKYLYKITGEKLDVECGGAAEGSFFLQESADGDYPENKFDRASVRAENGCVIFSGENFRSVLYSVYDFLQDRCGVRFFAPGEAFEHIEKQDLMLPEDLCCRYGSAVEFRDFVNRTNHPEVLSFAAKNRINSILGCGPWVNGSDGCSVENAELIHSAGLMVRGPGHSWKHFVPDASLFETHPEYFPMFHGERKPNGRTACFSNPAVRKIFQEKLRAYLQAHPYWDIFAFWAEDVPDHVYCDCPECRKKNVTDWYLTLVNESAQTVAELLPETRFEFILYQATLTLPETTEALYRNGENMLVNFCLGQRRDIFYPLDAPTRNNTDLMTQYRTWSDALKKLDYRGKMIVMDYYNLCEYPNTSPAARALLWPLDLIAQDTRFFHKNGIDGFGAFTGFDRLCFPDPLNLWYRIRIWNDPSLEPEDLKQDFYTKFFSRNGAAIRNWSEKRNALMRDADNAENIAALETMKNDLPDTGDAFKTAVILCHLDYAILLKKMFRAYRENDRAGWEKLKTAEYLVFQENKCGILEKAVAPFPMLWFQFLVRYIGWRDDGSRIEFRETYRDTL